LAAASNTTSRFHNFSDAALADGRFKPAVQPLAIALAA
jgi:hypothetical protein